MMMMTILDKSWRSAEFFCLIFLGFLISEFILWIFFDFLIWFCNVDYGLGSSEHWYSYTICWEGFGSFDHSGRSPKVFSEMVILYKCTRAFFKTNSYYKNKELRNKLSFLFIYFWWKQIMKHVCLWCFVV